MRKAIICFLQKDNKVLLLHTKYPDKVVWNGVSGYIDAGETARQAACREVQEEIDVKIREKDVKYLGKNDIFTIYGVERWNGEPVSNEESILEIKWFPIQSLPFDEMHEGNKIWLKKLL